MEVARLLHDQGEIAKTSTLIAQGASRRDIAESVSDGTVSRVMRGWICTPRADAEQILAVRSGGRLGCISALARWGLWSADDRSPHVSMPRRGRGSRVFQEEGVRDDAVMHPRAAQLSEVRPRLQRPVRFHWAAQPAAKSELDWIVSPGDAIRQAVLCQNLEHAVACVDSAVHTGVLTADEWGDIAARLPSTRRDCVALVDSRADSGLESRIRVRLIRLGHTVDVQVPVPGFGKLDILVDGRVGLELDGDRFHTTAKQRQRDTEKVLTSMLFGLPVLRSGYAQAINDWELVYDALTRMLQLTERRAA